MTEAAADDPVRVLGELLAADGYIADRALAMALHLARSLQQPLLLEGEPGVGKTSVAESLATVTGSRLVRLQCYEGLTAQQALYEWDYVRQLLSIRLGEAGGQPADTIRADIFSKEFLLRRPLLDAIWPVDDRPVVLLVDEVDRHDYPKGPMMTTSTERRQEFRVPGLPEPVSHYTDAVRWGDQVYISGCAAIGASGEVIAPGDALVQARVVHEYLDAVLRAAGTDFAHVLKVVVYLTDVNDRHAVNDVRKEFFGEARPASTLIEVKALVLPGLLVEIDAVAGVPMDRVGDSRVGSDDRP